jgi:uncharacterized protein YacL
MIYLTGLLFLIISFIESLRFSLLNLLSCISSLLFGLFLAYLSLRFSRKHNDKLIDFLFRNGKLSINNEKKIQRKIIKRKR